MNHEHHPLALAHGGLDFDRHGLAITGEISLDEWRHILGALQVAKDAYHCALADVINYGNHRFGAVVVGQVLEQMEFDMGDTNKAIAIGTLELEFRRANPLTSEHYFVLAEIRDTAKQAEWAKTALREKLTALELKRSIQAGKVVRTNEIKNLSGSGAGIVTVQGVVFQFQQWHRKIGGTEAALKLPEKDRRELLGHLSGVVELAAAIEESLS